MSTTQKLLSLRVITPATNFRSVAFLSLLLLTGTLEAQDRKPTDRVPGGDRKPSDGAQRGERQPGADRTPGAGGARPEFPAEIKLTDEQQSKLKEINLSLGTKQAELAKRRDGILTEEQKAAQAEAMKKIREATNLSRQEMADLVAAALKLTPQQQTQLEAVDLESQKLYREGSAQKAAVLTDEQRTTLRKLTIANGVARTCTIPGGITISDAQKTSLKALHEELGAKLADLTEKHSLILTDDRRAAREAAYKEARESGKDRQATADAIDAALKMSDAEKAQLAEIEQNLRELNQQIRDRMAALLTAEQKAELEKRFGVGRPRN